MRVLALSALTLVACSDAGSYGPPDAPPRPAATISPIGFDFMSVGVGAASELRPFEVTNTGNTGLVTVISTNDGQVRVVHDDCGYLEPGMSCEAQVAFVPGRRELTFANVIVTDGEGDERASAEVAGNGALSFLEISPQVASFGVVDVGQTSIEQTFVLSNTGLAAVKQPTIAFDLSEFEIVSRTCIGMLEPGAWCTFVARFVPVYPTRRNSRLRISSGDKTTQAQLVGVGQR